MGFSGFDWVCLIWCSSGLIEGGLGGYGWVCLIWCSSGLIEVGWFWLWLSLFNLVQFWVDWKWFRLGLFNLVQFWVDWRWFWWLWRLWPDYKNNQSWLTWLQCVYVSIITVVYIFRVFNHLFLEQMKLYMINALYFVCLIVKTFWEIYCSSSFYVHPCWNEGWWKFKFSSLY